MAGPAVAACLVLCMLLPCAATAATWRIESIDIGPIDFISGTNIALFGQSPRIAYNRGYYSNATAGYAYKSGGAWITQGLGDSHGGDSPSLFLDAQGRATMIYLLRDNRLVLASQGSTSWSFQPIAAMGNEVDAYSCARDASGRIHIISTTYLATQLYDVLTHGWFNGESWATETIGECVKTGDNRLAFDSFGKPNVAYERSAGLGYARQTGSSWTMEGVTGSSAADLKSLAVDRNGNPGILADTMTGLALYSKSGSVWTQSLVMQGPRPHEARLAYDKWGSPYVAYLDREYRLWLARLYGGTWYREMIDTDVSSDISMVIDALGNPHISYASRTDLIMYATTYVPEPSCVAVMLAGFVGLAAVRRRK